MAISCGVATIVNGMFATTVVCVNKYDWNYTWDFLNNNGKNGFSSDVCKEIENNLKNK